MGDFSIGMMLFMLIVVIGLVIGLRLSSTPSQRRAMVLAFASMVVVAVLFWAVAMKASQVWTAPFFALACAIVPLAIYMGFMRAAKTTQASAGCRDNLDGRASAGLHRRMKRTSSAIDNALMPVAPNHPVNEFHPLHRSSTEEGGRSAVKKVALESVIGDGGRHVAGASGSDNAKTAASDENAAPIEAFIEEYLVEQNEGEDGMFEPELAPALNPPPGPSHTTSTRILTVPFAEGDERYLIVSDTETVPNPLLAFKRTTSSRLVPLGPEHRDERPKHVERPEPVESPRAIERPKPAESPRAIERPKPPVEQSSSPVEQPKAIEQPEPASAPASAPMPASTPTPTPASASTSVPTSAPTSVPTPAPTSASSASPREAGFEEFLSKARCLRDKGLYPVAARLYGEAAALAEGAEARRARFEEMACYVKAGQGEKARVLAAELRCSNVLTRAERIKLDAVERMG